MWGLPPRKLCVQVIGLFGYLVKSHVGTPPWKLCVQVIGLFGYLAEILCWGPLLWKLSKLFGYLVEILQKRSLLSGCPCPSKLLGVLVCPSCPSQA